MSNIESMLRHIRASIGSEKILTSGPAFETACSVWNRSVVSSASVVIRCETSADVQVAIRAASAFGVSISVRGGGHDWAGRAVKGQLVLDLSRMSKVTVENGMATVGGGATSLAVAEAAGHQGLAAVTGNLGSVGIAGLTLGGGYGPLTGLAGMASDNLVGAEIVLANGRIVWTDEANEPDLLWALRGGGGNFGVVTSLRLRLYSAGKLYAGAVTFPWQHVEQVALAFGRFQLTAPEGLTLTPAFASGPDGNLALTLLYAWSGSEREESRVLQTIKEFGTPTAINISHTSYVQMLKDTEAFVVPNTSAFYRTVTLSDLEQEVVQAITASMANRSSPLSFIVLHPFHGAGEKVASTATAFALRRKHFVVGIYALWQGGDEVPHRAWANAVEQSLLPYSLPGGYPNYFGPDRPLQALDAYGANAEFLLRVKSEYDPFGMFNATSLPPQAAGRLR